MAGLAGIGGLRPTGRPLAAARRRGLCRFRMRRDAALAARDGDALVSRRRLGRAGRCARPRARQLRPALSHHLGNRSWRARALPAPREGACRFRAHRAEGPASREPHPDDARRGDRRRRRDPRTLDRRTRTEVRTRDRRRILDRRRRDHRHVRGIGGDFDLVRRNWPVDRLGPPQASWSPAFRITSTAA